LGLGDVLHAGKNLYEIAEKGAVHQASARDNLALNAIAAIVGGTNKLPYFADMNTAALADFTAFAKTLLSRTDASAVRGDLGLKSAAVRDVGTGASQIPDMSAFASVLAGNGKMRFPGGFLVQWGNAVPSLGTALVHYNEAFVDTPWFIGTTTRQAGFPTAMQSIIVDDSLSNNTQFSARTLAFDGTTFAASTSAFYWYAIGRG
ncbi:gp53-like domain-containing protein, partial [Citrobacter freundii]|uniref:gp53-like domain-containing protein n=1 Tax=Citrobacter freundii TaxID=546 RepID=UPI001B38ED29